MELTRAEFSGLSQRYCSAHEHDFLGAQFGTLHSYLLEVNEIKLSAFAHFEQGSDCAEKDLRLSATTIEIKWFSFISYRDLQGLQALLDLLDHLEHQ